MRIAKIMHNDTVDGIGICVSVWTQFCPNHCKGCHNPDTWSKDGGYEKDLEDVIDEVIDSLDANGVQRNLSILGGEPLAEVNIHPVMEIIRRAKSQFPELKVYLWTGYTYEHLLEMHNHDLMDILCMVDVLIDGPFILEQRDISLPLRGSKNQRIMIHDKSLKPMCFREIRSLKELE